MKYLFIFLIMFNFSTILGQLEQLSSEKTSLVEPINNWVISSGIYLNTFEHYLVRMTYLNRLSKQISIPFEAEVIVVEPNSLIFGSASIRIHQNLFTKTNGFIQGGFSFILGGVESLAIIPIFNCGLGINYNVLCLELRTLILNTSSLNNSIPLFFSMGVSF